MDILGKDIFDRPIHLGDVVEVTIRIYNTNKIDYQIIKLIGKVQLFKEDPRTNIPCEKSCLGVIGFDHRNKVDQFVVLDFKDPLIQIKRRI